MVDRGFLFAMPRKMKELLKIVNNSGEEINLVFDKLSTLIDDTDSTMKKTLLKVKSSGCANTVNTLNKLIAAFHEPENKIIITSSLSVIKKPRERRQCSNDLKKVPTASGVVSTSSAAGDVETLSIRLSRSRDSYASSGDRKRKRSPHSSEKKRKGSQLSSEERPSKKSNLESESLREEEDIFTNIEQIIKEAHQC